MDNFPFFSCLFCHHRICLTISNKRFLFSIVFFFVAMFTHHLSWSGVTTNKTCATIFGYLIDPPVASKIGLLWWEELLFKILSKGVVPRFSSTLLPLLKRKRNEDYFTRKITKSLKTSSGFQLIFNLWHKKQYCTVMDNDYLTRWLVKLLTNLLNNHCPWL